MAPTLPSVVGLSPVEARGLIRALGLHAQLVGTPPAGKLHGRRVAAQQPPAGQPVPPDAIVRLIVDNP